ncbi:hypothetical protein Tco_0480286 [Tanacetum coccineum]
MLLAFTSFFFWAFSSVVTGLGIVEVEVPSAFAVVRATELDKEEKETEEEFVKTPFDYTPTDDEDETRDETNNNDNVEDDEDDRITRELYDDVYVKLTDPYLADEGTVHEETTDAEKIDAQLENVHQEPTFDQVMEDAHVTFTAISVSVQSSSISSDLASKYVTFENIPTTEAEIVSSMDITVHHEEPSIQTPSLLTIPVSVISETTFVFISTIPPPMTSFIPPPQ